MSGSHTPVDQRRFKPTQPLGYVRLSYFGPFRPIVPADKNPFSAFRRIQADALLRLSTHAPNENELIWIIPPDALRQQQFVGVVVDGSAAVHSDEAVVALLQELRQQPFERRGLAMERGKVSIVGRSSAGGAHRATGCHVNGWLVVGHWQL